MTAPAPTVEISAVMPAYNEEANLEQSVGQMAKALQTFSRGFEIIVVDDGSQDGTAAVLDRLKVAHPNLRVIRHPVNRGYGAALRSGFGAARFSWIFLMDADNQFDPADVSALLAGAADADIVAGYRRQRRDRQGRGYGETRRRSTDQGRDCVFELCPLKVQELELGGVGIDQGLLLRQVQSRGISQIMP